MSDWEYLRIDELGDKKRPVLKAGPYGSSVKKESYVKEGYKLYGQQEVLQGNVNARNYYVDSKTYQSHKSCAVASGDILITMMGTIGRILVVPENHEHGIINPRLMRISLDKKRINPLFAKLFLESSKIQNLLERRSHGGTMPGLNASSIGSIKIPVPSLTIQRDAVGTFEKWDRAIEMTENLIAAKQQQFEWLQNTLIPYKKAEQKDTLSKYAKISKKEKITSIHDLKPLTVKLHCKGIEANNRDRQIILSDKGRPYHKRFSGEFLIGRQNFHNGGFGIIPQELDGYIASNAITTLDINTEKLDAEYLFYYFSRKNYYLRIGHIMDGTGQKELSDSQIMKLPVKIPSIPEQKSIAHTLNTAQGEIKLLQALAEKYRTQKRGLMQKLLSGQWRLNDKKEAA